MTSQPDKYFRDHLQHYRKTPPENAWNRIEGNIQKKKSFTLRIRSIAAVLITAISACCIWYALQSPASQDITNTSPNKLNKQNPPTTEKPANHTEESKIIIPVSPHSNNSVTEHTTSHSIKSVKDLPAPHQQSANQVTESQIKEIEFITPESITSTEAISENIEPSPISITIKEEIEKENISSGKKIFYSATDIQNRFLKKQSTIAEESNKSASGIEKILDIAGNIRYETAFGDIRQMKNEIFSIPAKGPKNN